MHGTPNLESAGPSRDAGRQSRVCSCQIIRARDLEGQAIRDAAMVERSDKGKRSCMLLKGAFTCENGCYVGGDVCPAWHRRERGGSWSPGESPHRTYEKAFAMPMAGPAMWKKLSFLSGVNLDKLPTSQFLCSLGCKQVVTQTYFLR